MEFTLVQYASLFMVLTSGVIQNISSAPFKRSVISTTVTTVSERQVQGRDTIISSLREETQSLYTSEHQLFISYINHPNNPSVSNRSVVYSYMCPAINISNFRSMYPIVTDRFNVTLQDKMASHLEVLTQFQLLMPGVVNDIIHPVASQLAEDVHVLIGRIITGVELLIDADSLQEGTSRVRHVPLPPDEFIPSQCLNSACCLPIYYVLQELNHYVRTTLGVDISELS